MPLQGPIVIVGDQPNAELKGWLTAAGVAQIETSAWAYAAQTIEKTWPSAVVIDEVVTTGRANDIAAMARALDAMREPYLPVLSRVAPDCGLALPGALPISQDANGQRIAAQVASVLRVRSLHATVFRRHAALKADGGTAPDMPQGDKSTDPMDDAIVLVAGRGRSYPELCTAVGERSRAKPLRSRDRSSVCGRMLSMRIRCFSIGMCDLDRSVG